MQKNSPTQAQIAPLRERKRRLSQYRRLLREIQADKLRLSQLAGRLLGANPAGLPAAGGHALSDYAAYREKVEANVARCVALVEELQDFINSIEDSDTRRLFTMRYINGFSWQKIAFQLGGYDESWPRKKHDRYLSSHPE